MYLKDGNKNFLALSDVSGGIEMSVQVGGFYKVIVVRVDIFDSEIVDERHFTYGAEAMKFCNDAKGKLGPFTFTVLLRS